MLYNFTRRSSQSSLILGWTYLPPLPATHQHSYRVFYQVCNSNTPGKLLCLIICSSNERCHRKCTYSVAGDTQKCAIITDEVMDEDKLKHEKEVLQLTLGYSTY